MITQCPGITTTNNRRNSEGLLQQPQTKSRIQIRILPGWQAITDHNGNEIYLEIIKPTKINIIKGWEKNTDGTYKRIDNDFISSKKENS